MGVDTAVKRRHVDMKSYPLTEDITLRSELSNLDNSTLKVLEALFYASLVIKVDEFKDELEMSKAQLLLILNTLQKLNLLTCDGTQILVDKQRRRYLEIETQRFHEDFRGDVNYFFCLLDKLSPDILISWYPVARSSNNIKKEICEGHFSTPKLYYRHLLEFCKEEPQIAPVIQELLTQTEIFISKERVCALLGCEASTFYALSLKLEFHLVGYLTNKYDKEGKFVEGITLWAQWRDYITHLYQNSLKAFAIEEPLEDPFADLKKFGKWIAKLNEKRDLA
jgi:hypothetical protein